MRSVSCSSTSTLNVTARSERLTAGGAALGAGAHARQSGSQRSADSTDDARAGGVSSFFCGDGVPSNGAVDPKIGSNPGPAIPNDGLPHAEIPDAVPGDVAPGHVLQKRDLRESVEPGLVADGELGRIEPRVPADLVVDLAARARSSAGPEVPSCSRGYVSRKRAWQRRPRAAAQSRRCRRASRTRRGRRRSCSTRAGGGEGGASTGW